MTYDPEDPAGFSMHSRFPETKILQKDYWERRSKGYNLSTLLELHNSQLYRQLISSLIPSGRRVEVCDMGTSCGLMAMVAAEMGHNVTGVDYSPRMIHYARNNAKNKGYTIQFVNADVGTKFDSDDKYDLIIAKSIIWCLEKPVEAITNWVKMLKPGGHILIIDGNYYLGLFESDYAHMQRLKTITDSDNKSMHGKTNIDHVNFEELNALVKDLPAAGMRRPGWDLHVLMGLGLDSISADIMDTDPFRTISSSGPMVLPNRFYIAARKPPAGTDAGMNSLEAVRDLAESYRVTLSQQVGLFKVLSDENRLLMLRILINSEMSVKNIADIIGISIALASHNLKVLSGAGLVASRKVGRDTIYRVNDLALVRNIVRQLYS